MTGPLWDDCSLDGADVSGLFGDVLIRHAMPCPCRVTLNVMMRIAGAQDLPCIALSSASLRLARAGQAGLMIDRVLVCGWLADDFAVATICVLASWVMCIEARF